MAKLSSFIIGLIVFSVFIAGSVIPLMDSMPPTGYDSNSLEFYNKLDNLTSDSEEIKKSSLSLQSKSGVLDVLGGFFEAGYDTLKISLGSFEIFDSLTNQAIADTNIDNAEIYRKGVTTIVIIAIFLGILVAAVVKRDI